MYYFHASCLLVCPSYCTPQSLPPSLPRSFRPSLSSLLLMHTLLATFFPTSYFLLSPIEDISLAPTLRPRPHPLLLLLLLLLLHEDEKGKKGGRKGKTLPSSLYSYFNPIATMDNNTSPPRGRSSPIFFPPPPPPHLQPTQALFPSLPPSHFTSLPPPYSYFNTTATG